MITDPVPSDDVIGMTIGSELGLKLNLLYLRRYRQIKFAEGQCPPQLALK